MKRSLLLVVGVIGLFSSGIGAVESIPDTFPTFKLKGLIQYDTELSGLKERIEGPRRIRTDFRGKIAPKIGYRFNIEYQTGIAVLFDANIIYEIDEHQTVVVGKIKPSLGLEFNQSPANLLMGEFGFTTYLVPNRDTGIYYTYKTKSLEVNLATATGAGDFQNVDTDIDHSRSLLGRIFWHPIQDASQIFGIGVSGTSEGRNGAVGKTGLGNYQYPGYGKLFDYSANTYADGHGYRILPQAYFYTGPVGVLLESGISSQEITKATAHATAEVRAWQGVFQWVLTGEQATYGELIPAHPFEDGKGLGAFQLGVRVGELSFNDALTPFAVDNRQATYAHELGATLNWIWNRSVRLVFSVEHLDLTSFNGATTSETFAVLRNQVTF